MNLGDGLRNYGNLCATTECDARSQCEAKDLEWMRFQGLLDSSCAPDRDAGTYIATSRAIRMAM